MGRRDEAKGTELHQSRHLKRWDKEPHRQDTRTDYETDVRRARDDTVLAERHAQYDLAAQDKTPKSARPHFAVVGEGSKNAGENFRRGYAALDWSNDV